MGQVGYPGLRDSKSTFFLSLKRMYFLKLMKHLQAKT